MVEELKTLPPRNRKQYCLAHGENTDHNSLQCLWLTVAKYLRTKEIGQGHQT